MNSCRNNTKEGKPSATAGVPKRERGRLFIVSAPSGAGKTTLCDALLKRVPGMVRSVSYTTRQARNGEKNGIDYHFISKQEFEKGIEEGRWAEWAKVHDNYYGTSADFIESALDSKTDVLLNIDVQGAKQLFSRYPDSTGIFIMPPSIEELRRRLEARGTDSREAIEKRLRAAGSEMAESVNYHHVILNDDLQTAIDELVKVVTGYRRTNRTGRD